MACLIVLCCLSPAPGQAGGVEVEGFVGLQGIASRSSTPWLQGGFGRLTTGEEDADERDATAFEALGQLNVTLNWQASKSWGAFVHGVARAEPSATQGDAFGVVEAYLRGEWVYREADLVRLRLGHFFLPSSRENVEVGWSSPYTLTFSALNSWIGEETRLTGALIESTHLLPNADQLTLGASVFGGNDSNGSLLAWRGWAFGDRLSTFGEVLPLPPQAIFEPGGTFAVQRDDGTQPFGNDLDGRAGYSGFVRWQRDDRFLVQYTHYDNQGDRYLHEGEYAWDTTFDILGLEAHHGNLSWVGEYLWGTSGMGFPQEAHVDIDIEAVYLLVSWSPRTLRWTLRYDHFEVLDLDAIAQDDNRDNGRAWTVAAFWEPSPNLRLGAEFLDVDAQRPGNTTSGFDSNADGRSYKLELRWYFDLGH